MLKRVGWNIFSRSNLVTLKVDLRRKRIFVWRRYYSTNVHQIGTALSSMDWRIRWRIFMEHYVRTKGHQDFCWIISINIKTVINVKLTSSINSQLENICLKNVKIKYDTTNRRVPYHMDHIKWDIWYGS